MTNPYEIIASKRDNTTFSFDKKVMINLLTGAITLADGLTPDEVARAFWDAITHIYAEMAGERAARENIDRALRIMTDQAEALMEVATVEQIEAAKAICEEYKLARERRARQGTLKL